MDYINIILTVILIVLGYCSLVRGSCKNSYDCFTNFVEKYKIFFIIASIAVVAINIKLNYKSDEENQSSES